MSQFNKVNQDIVTSTKNFTTTNLASAAEFRGLADSIQGVNAIQVLKDFFKKDNF